MDKKVFKVLIIGAGKIGAFFDAPNSEEVLTFAHGFYGNNSFELKGFYDVNYDCACEAAKLWNCNAYNSLDEAMRDVDIVCCCVPDKYHFDILMEISKYPVELVVTEKPLVENVEQAKIIEDKYRKKTVALNYSRRYLREFRELKEQIKEYGEFVKGVGYYGKGLLHNGSHMIDILSFLIGDVTDIGKKRFDIEDFFEDDKSVDVSFKLKKGIFNMIAIDCRVATIFEIELFFEKARVRILNGGTKIETYLIKESESFKGYYNYVYDREEIIDYSYAMKGLVNNIESYMNYGGELFCTIEDGINVLRICDEIRGN